MRGLSEYQCLTFFPLLDLHLLFLSFSSSFRSLLGFVDPVSMQGYTVFFLSFLLSVNVSVLSRVF